jgi:hypothetical protein
MFPIMAGIIKGTFLFMLFMFSAQVFASPSAYFELINGTPYDWILVYHHSYKMDWKPPAIVRTGNYHKPISMPCD